MSSSAIGVPSPSAIEKGSQVWYIIKSIGSEGGKTVKELAINEKIQAPQVLVIGVGGERLGVMPTTRALQIAREQGLDLVEVASQQNPPVCRILDYGKYKYEQTKKEQKAKRGQRVGLLREVKLRPKIKDHDLGAKARQVQRLLGEGNKVKVMVEFRGREVTHPELGWKVLQGLAQSLKGMAVVERSPTMEGEGGLTVIFAPLKREKDAQAKNP